MSRFKGKTTPKITTTIRIVEPIFDGVSDVYSEDKACNSKNDAYSKILEMGLEFGAVLNGLPSNIKLEKVTGRWFVLDPDTDEVEKEQKHNESQRNFFKRLIRKDSKVIMKRMILQELSI